MSIYATWLSIDEDDEGLGAPYLYYGSHVFPSADDARGGWLYLCAIPGHISSDRITALDDEDSCHPWLRLSMGEEGSGDGTTLVINRAQAEHMHDMLTEWLARSQPKTHEQE